MSPDIDAVDVDAVSGAAPAPVNAEFAALTNRQKVAILLAQLGAKGAAPILKEMSDEETILVTKEIVRLPPLSNATVTAVVAEFMERFGRSDEHGLGGVTLAREFLEERLGVTRAEEVMVQIEGPSSSSPLSTFMKNDPEQVLGVLSAQQPQVIAVLLSYLPPAEAARLLAGLEPALRTEVARRVAHLTSVDPVAVRQITSLLVGKLQAQSGGGASTVAGGTSAMADILSHADRSVEQQVLGDLEAHDADLAKEIRAGMFTFDDVMALDDKYLQQIFRKLEAPTIALTFKSPDLGEEVFEKIRRNLSERVLAMVNEEMDVMGGVRTSQIDGALSAIVAVARQLDAEGVIIIANDEEVIA